MSDSVQLLVFSVRGQRHALRLDAVSRVTRATEVTPLPGAPPAVLGAIDVGGCILPVFSLGVQMGLTGRALRLSDVFLIVQAANRPIALLVDEVQGVRWAPATMMDAAALAPGMRTVRGVVRLDDGLLLIHDLERLLSGEDEYALDAAMRQAA